MTKSWIDSRSRGLTEPCPHHAHQSRPREHASTFISAGSGPAFGATRSPRRVLIRKAIPMSTVLVTGATGHLGSHLLPRLLASGHQVRTFSRSTRTTMKPGLAAFTGDLTDGTGLADAVAGVDTVVHCASDPRHPVSDVTSTNNLLKALAKCGTDAHMLYISIVGVDAVPCNYYRAKHEAEQAVETAKLSWTIQRATQFHTFVDAMVGRLAQSPLMVLPRGFAFQPVATAEVADRLIEHVNHGPVGRAEDFGGPIPSRINHRSQLAHRPRQAPSGPRTSSSWAVEPRLQDRRQPRPRRHPRPLHLAAIPRLSGTRDGRSSTPRQGP
jgi:uncharacterized protein YbjT (DUF2867 family)